MSCCAPTCCTTDSQENIQVRQASTVACCAPSLSTSASDDAGRPSGARISSLPIAIIGAGPVGLAAAAQLIARGLDCIILESGPSVGTAARAWGHVRMFSPWRYNIDAASRTLLASHEWHPPASGQFPTGRELVVNYLEPLACTPEIAARLRLDAQVTAITRTGLGKVRSAGRDDASFELRIEDAHGNETRVFAR